jgi:dethiobiotin synthetase
VTVLVVTGTGTGVGKTVVTAAVAALSRSGGQRTAVVKVAQTGLGPGQPSDLDHVQRLARVASSELVELARFTAALSPEAAARLESRSGPDLDRCAEQVADVATGRDMVAVEGAGGLLVRYAASGWTLADLAARLGAPVLVVVEAGLGTLNATALTTQALADRGIACAGVVIGSWPVAPDVPGLAERSNLADLPVVSGVRLAGAMPAHAGTLDPDAFLAAASAGLDPRLGGEFDAADFASKHGLTPGPAERP